MRSPSSRILTNTVDIYRYAPTQDADGGIAPSPYGAAAATAVACSVQPDDPMRLYDDKTGRIIEKTVYDVLFATDYSLKADDKLVWTDDAGTTRTLFVMGTANQAGRGGCFSVSAEERQ